VLRGKKGENVVLSEIKKQDKIVDIGLESVKLISEKIQKAKVIVWNGPTGWYEGGFTWATTTLAKVMTRSKAFCIIGGGDTGAVVEKVANNSKNIFVSTGGGATLDYLAKGTLIGIQCLK
jgi:phosphoglycerate kinase